MSFYELYTEDRTQPLLYGLPLRNRIIANGATFSSIRNKSVDKEKGWRIQEQIPWAWSDKISDIFNQADISNQRYFEVKLKLRALGSQGNNSPNLIYIVFVGEQKGHVSKQTNNETNGWADEWTNGSTWRPIMRFWYANKQICRTS